MQPSPRREEGKAEWECRREWEVLDGKSFGTHEIMLHGMSRTERERAGNIWQE